MADRAEVNPANEKCSAFDNRPWSEVMTCLMVPTKGPLSESQVLSRVFDIRVLSTSSLSSQGEVAPIRGPVISPVSECLAQSEGMSSLSSNAKCIGLRREHSPRFTSIDAMHQE